MPARFPYNLPPLTAPQELPPEPLDCRLVELSGWWLYIQCECQRGIAAHPLRLMAAQHPPGTIRYARFCAGCDVRHAKGGRPKTLQLVDDPARVNKAPAGDFLARPQASINLCINQRFYFIEL